MAVDVVVIKQVMCDICLKRDKTKTEATRPEFATLLLSNGPVVIDLCDEHAEGLTYAQIVAFGYPRPKDGSGLSARPRASRGGTREPVVCSRCDKRTSMGAGWTVHNQWHQARGEHDAVPIRIPT